MSQKKKKKKDFWLSSPASLKQPKNKSKKMYLQNFRVTECVCKAYDCLTTKLYT